MAKYYEACPKCGRTNFGAILHCNRCGTEFCQKCTGKRKYPDGTAYECCPRCGAEIDEDEDTVQIVVTEKENAKNKK